MKKPLMKLETKIKIMLWKNYFDYGFSYFNYIKYFLYIFVGYDVFINKEFTWFWIIGMLTFILSLSIGYLYYKTDFARANTEVSNMYNPFAEEVRKKLKIKSFKK